MFSLLFCVFHIHFLQCPYGLYAEQLSGTAFTVPRTQNQRSWLYRIRPSVVHSKFVREDFPKIHSTFSESDSPSNPDQLRWFPKPLLGPEEPACDFIHGIETMGGSGDPNHRSGIAIHMYACNKPMINCAMYNSDGDFLIVPQVGTLDITTEFGKLSVSPTEIVVIQRGIVFQVNVSESSRGYICEVYNGHFKLPDLGPIGSNGLASPRDFLFPVARFEDVNTAYKIYNKFGGKLFSAELHHSPFNVVAFHGNYVPFKYDLKKFNTINTVSFDHPDPSIFTVLTCATDTPGVALCDFVIFPPRWMVGEDTFRPPYYHRNLMSEFMGLITGGYDAKVGFQPGGASLHSPMTPHGPDATTFVKASTAELLPHKQTIGLAFMFETYLTLRVTQTALDAKYRDFDYQKCWSSLPRAFDPAKVKVENDDVREKEYTGMRGAARGEVDGEGRAVRL
jgi:homogentisate 1,2-dioxygenase